MAHLKYDASTGHLAYNPDDHLVYDCGEEPTPDPDCLCCIVGTNTSPRTWAYGGSIDYGTSTWDYSPSIFDPRTEFGELEGDKRCLQLVESAESGMYFLDGGDPGSARSIIEECGIGDAVQVNGIDYPGCRVIFTQAINISGVPNATIYWVSDEQESPFDCSATIPLGVPKYISQPAMPNQFGLDWSALTVTINP